MMKIDYKKENSGVLYSVYFYNTVMRSIELILYSYGVNNLKQASNSITNIIDRSIEEKATRINVRARCNDAIAHRVTR